MNTAEDRTRDPRRGWEHVGRAAEHFARRVARDARRFAERVEAHVGEFAHDVRHEWSCGQRAEGRGRPRSSEDIQHVFQDVRGVLSGILDGIDEFITRTFQGEPAAEWTRVVSNHDVACGKCGRAIPAGQEAHVRGPADRREFRCLDCGRPGEPS